MATVLQDGIVELIFLAVDILNPVLGIFPAVYPSVVVLGLNDKDAVNRHNKVVNLGAPLGCWDGHIVEYPVLIFRQVIQLPCNDFFSDLSPGGNRPAEQDYQSNEKD